MPSVSIGSGVEVVVSLVVIAAMCAWSRARRHGTLRRKLRERRQAMLVRERCRDDRNDRLGVLVDELAAVAPAEVARLELDALLDTHARLLVQRRQLADALLTRAPNARTHVGPACASVRRYEVAYRAEWARRILVIDEQLDALDALVRLYCERSVVARDDLADDASPLVARGLAVADAEDRLVDELAEPS